MLAIAFLIKSAMWPLGFWLPTTYAAASPPVAAMLVLMTKVGAYIILRLWLLVFSGDAGAGGRLRLRGAAVGRHGDHRVRRGRHACQRHGLAGWRATARLFRPARCWP